jgi:hypothetical protein
VAQRAGVELRYLAYLENSPGQPGAATLRRLAAAYGKADQPQLVQSLNVAAHPLATIALARPFALSEAFSSGAVVTSTAAASLTLNGTTRPVTVRLSARRDGTAIEAAGSLPVTFADFGIKGPHGYGVFGSLASNGIAEFLLILAPAVAG